MSAEVKADPRGDLAPDLRRTYSIAGDANNPVLLAEKIQGLGRLFGYKSSPTCLPRSALTPRTGESMTPPLKLEYS